MRYLLRAIAFFFAGAFLFAAEESVVARGIGGGMNYDGPFVRCELKSFPTKSALDALSPDERYALLLGRKVDLEELADFRMRYPNRPSDWDWYLSAEAAEKGKLLVHYSREVRSVPEKDRAAAFEKMKNLVKDLFSDFAGTDGIAELRKEILAAARALAEDRENAENQRRDRFANLRCSKQESVADMLLRDSGMDAFIDALFTIYPNPEDAETALNVYEECGFPKSGIAGKLAWRYRSRGEAPSPDFLRRYYRELRKKEALRAADVAPGTLAPRIGYESRYAWATREKEPNTPIVRCNVKSFPSRERLEGASLDEKYALLLGKRIDPAEIESLRLENKNRNTNLDQYSSWSEAREKGRLIWELTQRAFARRDEISREDLVVEIGKIKNLFVDALYDYDGWFEERNRWRGVSFPRTKNDEEWSAFRIVQFNANRQSAIGKYVADQGRTFMRFVDLLVSAYPEDFDKALGVFDESLIRQKTAWGEMSELYALAHPTETAVTQKILEGIRAAEARREQRGQEILDRNIRWGRENLDKELLLPRERGLSFS